MSSCVRKRLLVNTPQAIDALAFFKDGPGVYVSFDESYIRVVTVFLPFPPSQDPLSLFVHCQSSSGFGPKMKFAILLLSALALTNSAFGEDCQDKWNARRCSKMVEREKCKTFGAVMG